MKALIRFTVREKMLNLTTVIINLILFTVIGVSVFADVLFLDTAETETVNLDYSTVHLYPYLSQSDRIIYQISEKADNPVLHYDRGYELYSVEKGKDVIDRVEEDLKKGLKRMYEEKGDILTREYLKELEEIENIRIRQNSGNRSDIYLTVTSAIMYFLLSAFAALTANDITYDRNTANLELILSCLKPREYLVARLTASWLPLLMQMGLTIIYFTVFIIARLAYDGFAGFGSALSVNPEIKMPGIISIVMTVIIMIEVLLKVQLFMADVALSEKKSSEYSQKLVLFQAVLLCMNYLVVHFSTVIINTKLFEFVPFINAIIGCSRMLEGDVDPFSCLLVMTEELLILVMEFRMIEKRCFRKIGE